MDARYLAPNRVFLLPSRGERFGRQVCCQKSAIFRGILRPEILFYCHREARNIDSNAIIIEFFLKMTRSGSWWDSRTGYPTQDSNFACQLTYR